MDGSQTWVSYELRRDGVVVQSLKGTGNRIVFEGVTGDGNYSIWGVYNSMSIQMNGTVLLSDVSSMVLSLDNTKSYLVERTILKEGIKDTNDLKNLDVYGQAVEIQYLDVLGRSVQNISVKSSPNKADIVQIQKYDRYGEQSKTYLPYTKSLNHGNFVTNDTSVENWKVYGDTDKKFAFAEVQKESSSLNRVIKKGSFGKTWQLNSKVDSCSYGMNSANEVKLFAVGDDGQFLSKGYYLPGRLHKTVVVDANGSKSEEFKDFEGCAVLNRSYDGNEVLSTYSVYDDFGLLRYVLSPMAEADTRTITSDILEKYCYVYKYDGYGRQVMKKLPGIDSVCMVYDSKDRLVLAQNGEQRKDDKWGYVLYDKLNRNVETGECVLTDSHEKLQIDIGKSINYVPSSRDSLCITYYDDYGFAGISERAFDETKNISDYSNGDQKYNDHVSGLVTGTKVKVLDGTGNKWIVTVNYYDDKCRLIQAVRNLYPSGTNLVSTKYDFIGNVLQIREYQSYSGNINTVDKFYKYDHRGRLLTIEQKRNSQVKQELCSMDYDEVGRLKNKILHEGIETTDYSYNIRNWITGIHGSKFEMDLFYNDVSSFGDLDNKALYNGNISAIRWRNIANSEETSRYRNYAFRYDGANRLLKADYGEGIIASNKAGSEFDVIGISYDKNGNIKSLSRKYGSSIIDNLTYNYIGNKLNYVDDVASDGGKGFTELSNVRSKEYNYDKNGNLTKDLNKGLVEISYNCLNLSNKVVKGANTVHYIYTATGEKLQNILPNKTITYNGGFVYEDGALQYILNEEGRYNVGGENAGYEYNLKDHLGNVRMVINSAGSIRQSNNYYPFGGVFEQFGSTDNKYQYGGKELQEEIDWLDFGARMYQSELGRWLCFDPMADKAHNIAHSSYNYCVNNPMNLIDPDGMDWFYYSVDGYSDPTWNWHEGSEFHTGLYDQNGEEFILLGTEAVVVFEGSLDERLGTKRLGDKGYDNIHSDGYIDGEGAITAKVTVYGPDGFNDIKTYTGYTMSSDPFKYGIVADGIYDGNYDKKGKRGALKSNWTLNKRGRVPTYWDNPFLPDQKDINGNYYMTGIFIHRSNNSGWAGGGVSKGCLLILPSDWKSFNNQMNGVKNFKVQVTRTFRTPYKLYKK